MNNLKLPESVTVLLAAVNILEEEGWTKGTYHHSKNGHCAVGAIYAASDRMRLSHSSAQFALETEIGGTHIPRWNDKWYRTKKSVLRRFRAAIDAEMKTHFNTVS